MSLPLNADLCAYLGKTYGPYWTVLIRSKTKQNKENIMHKYLALVVLVTSGGCVAKPIKPTQPYKTFPGKLPDRAAQFNFNYYCPVSSMDEFHRNLPAHTH